MNFGLDSDEEELQPFERMAKGEAKGKKDTKAKKPAAKSKQLGQLDIRHSMKATAKELSSEDDDDDDDELGGNFGQHKTAAVRPKFVSTFEKEKTDKSKERHFLPKEQLRKSEQKKVGDGALSP